jgi:hypothetical protein
METHEIAHAGFASRTLENGSSFYRGWLALLGFTRVIGGDGTLLGVVARTAIATPSQCGPGGRPFPAAAKS